jgi:hypothetical protein
MEASWPRAKDVLARGVLAVCLRRGAKDIADETEISRKNVRLREYHHLFPVKLLDEDAKLPRQQINLALNCALISTSTNRSIGAKEPLSYLRERTNAELVSDEHLQKRLGSHLIPYDQLRNCGYSRLSASKKATQIKADYEAFLRARAELVRGDIEKLCEGMLP